MKETSILAFKLFIIAAFSALVLSVVNNITEPVVAERELAQYLASLEEVFPEAEEFEPVGEEKVEELRAADSQIEDVAIAKKAGQAIGWTIKASGKGGYGGDVEIVYAVNSDKEILGFTVLASSETPGIGSVIQEDAFKESLLGKSVATEVKAVAGASQPSEIEAVSGATYSVTAVINGINAGVNALQGLGE